MKRIHFKTFLIVLLIFGLGLAQEDEQAIDDLRQQFEDLYNEGDLQGVAELYAEDAVLYDPFGQVHEGRDAIQEAWQGVVDADLTEMNIEHIETEVINDTAYAVAHWTATNDAGETGAEGYSLVILQRENGEWQIHRHITNLVMPEQGQNGGEGETGGGG
jgi:uncharacterized protein (TIGR02246 family)